MQTSQVNHDFKRIDLSFQIGLGKTATILSLVMRTRGILPSVTEKMCWERQELGRNDAKRADDFQKLSALHSLRPRSNFSSPFKPVSPPIFMDPMFPAPPVSFHHIKSEKTHRFGFSHLFYPLPKENVLRFLKRPLQATHLHRISLWIFQRIMMSTVGCNATSVTPGECFLQPIK